MTSPRLAVRTPLVLLVLPLVYFIAGKLGLMLAHVHPNATAVWPPTAIALVALLFFGLRVWPGVLVGAFLVNATMAGSIIGSVGIAIGNTAEGLLGAMLVNRYANGYRALDRGSDAFKFFFLAGLVSPLVSATMGRGSILNGGEGSVVGVRLTGQMRPWKSSEMVLKNALRRTTKFFLTRCSAKSGPWVGLLASSATATQP